MSETRLGIYKGVVVDNSDPSGTGRVIAEVPTVLGEARSNWCEPTLPTVYKPRIGEVIWVQFVDGDLSKPVYASSDAVTAEKIVAGSITASHLNFTPITDADVTANVGQQLAEALAPYDLETLDARLLDITGRLDDKVTVHYDNPGPPAGLGEADDGDLWVDIANGNLLYRYVYLNPTGVGPGLQWDPVDDERLAEALATAGTAEAIADSKIRTFFSVLASPPTGTMVEGVLVPPAEGDLWFVIDEDNLVKRYDPDTTPVWQDVPFGADALDVTAQELGAIEASVGSTQPVAARVGDLWLDTTVLPDGTTNVLKTWNGTAWVRVQDANVQAAITAATDAANVADGKMSIYYANGGASHQGPTLTNDEPPRAFNNTTDVGDLWFEVDNGNKAYRWNGTAWAAFQFGAPAISATARQLGAVTTYQGTSPGAGPFVDGDIWIDTTPVYDGTGKLIAQNVVKRYDPLANPVWVPFQDQAISRAINDAAAVANLADGKMRIFYDPEPPVNGVNGVTLNDDSDLGDLWFDSNDGYKAYRWKGSAAQLPWEPFQFGSSAIATDAIKSTHIDDQQILTPHLQANSVTTDKLTVGTSSDNLARNPTFEDWTAPTVPDRWTCDTGTGYTGATYAKSAAGQQLTQTTSLVMTAASGNAARAYQTDFLSCTAGEKVYMSALCKGAAVVAGNAITVGFYFYDNAGVNITPAGATFSYPLNTTVDRRIHTMTVPANATSMRPVLKVEALAAGTAVTWDDVELRKMINGVVIADGAIDGKVITGATLQTGTTNPRVVIDSSGLKQYDGSNQVVVDIPSSGATSTFKGAVDSSTITGSWLRTAASGNRVEIGTNPAAPVNSQLNSIRFFNGTQQPGSLDHATITGTNWRSELRATNSEAKGTSSIELGAGLDVETDTYTEYTVTRPSGGTSWYGHQFTGGIAVDRLQVGGGPVFPVGTVQMFAGGTAPSGWVLCQGQFVTIGTAGSTYYALFQVIGHSYNNGVDPGNGTFKLPDFRDRAPRGASNVNTPLGTRAGSDTVFLNNEHLPLHTHDMTHDHLGMTAGGSHTHTYTWRESSTIFGAQTNIAAAGGTGGSVTTKRSAGTGESDHSHNIPQHVGNTGQGPGMGNPLTVTPSYQSINFMIKL